MNYSEKLKDPRWQRKRLEVLQRDDFTCLACGAKDKQLHVHHCYYVSGRDPWEYDSDSMLTWCKDCHKKADDDHESEAYSQGKSWEFAAHFELNRNRWNLKLGSEGGFDEGVVWSICAAANGARIPAEEWMNSVKEAFDSGMINAAWMNQLNRQVLEFKQARRQQAADTAIQSHAATEPAPDMTSPLSWQVHGPVPEGEDWFLWCMNWILGPAR